MKTIVNKKSNFTTIHNKLISDNSISLKAKGIMLYMLSKPAGWNYNPKDIANNSKDGLDSVYSGLKELIEAKYISRRKNKDGTVDYFVFEDNSENDITDYSNLNPNRENPNLGKPDMENPNLENPDVLIIKNSTNKEFNKMIVYESMIYSLKSLIIGIVISLGISYLIYKTIYEQLSKADKVFYQLPYQGIIISILVVFVIILVTMRYSIKKIDEDNIIETIRNENI